MLKLIKTKDSKEEKELYFEKDMCIYKDCSHLEVEIYYNKGGMNYWNSKNEPRGYWISLNLCQVREHSIVTVPTDGVRYFLKEVGRQSKKAFDTSIKLVDNDILSNLSNYKGYNLDRDEIEFILESIQEQFN